MVLRVVITTKGEGRGLTRYEMGLLVLVGMVKEEAVITGNWVGNKKNCNIITISDDSVTTSMDFDIRDLIEKSF